MRIALLSIISIIWLPLIVLAQTPQPAEVEQALRARVTEFLQYHVDGNFRKAYDLIAEDTKDAYFGAAKVRLMSFKIDSIKFSDDFTKATVTATMSKTMTIMGEEIPVTRPSPLTWKIENGEWVWYETAPASGPIAGLPAAAGAASPAPTSSDPGGELPKDFDPKTIAAAARSILQQVSVDKQEVTLGVDKTSEERVVFHNGMTGSVQLELTVPEIPGFSAKLEQAMVRAAQDVPVVFRYEPVDRAKRLDPIKVQLRVQPLGQVFVIQVNFATPSPLK